MSEPEHGIESAYYKLAWGGQEPALECCCGEECTGITWAEAGAELDKHLKEATHDDH